MDSMGGGAPGTPQLTGKMHRTHILQGVQVNTYATYKRCTNNKPTKHNS